MSVRDDLILDIRQAQRAIDTLESQLRAATSGITVTVNTAGITSEITRAVDAAPTGITVTADTASIAPKISGAIDQADSTVTVDANTAPASVAVRALGTDLDDTAKSADRLKTLLTFAAGAAAAK